MKELFFDSGPFISLTLNGLLWLLKPLKERFGGNFYITPKVKEELVDRPLEIKRFEFEALQIIRIIKEGVLEVKPSPDSNLLGLSNHIFQAKGNYLNLIQAGEAETLAATLQSETRTLVIDERTTRLMIENPDELVEILEGRLHCPIKINQKNLGEFSKLVEGIKVIRSLELVIVAYQLGILDSYIPDTKEGDRLLLDALAWALRVNGCSIAQEEIKKVVDFAK